MGNMSFFQSPETESILNAIGENIFVTDQDFTIMFINDYADDLIQEISPYTRINNKNGFIGKKMDAFHPQMQNDKIRALMQHYTSWPYQTTISLFDKYTASIVLDIFEENGERKGYVLTWKDVTNYETELRRDQSKLHDLYTTILDTSVDGCLLIPVAGYIDSERFLIMKDRILDVCEQKEAHTIIFDFSGFTNLSDPSVMKDIQEFKISLALLGVEQIITGIRASVVKEISGLPMSNLGLKIFPSFKQAILYVWEKRGLELRKKS